MLTIVFKVIIARNHKEYHQQQLTNTYFLNGMSSDDIELIKLVRRQLIEAENKRDTTKAGSILAHNFTVITRSTNGIEEEDKGCMLLNKITNPKDPTTDREIDDHDFQVWGHLAILA
jgi:hypothetical protein